MLVKLIASHFLICYINLVMNGSRKQHLVGYARVSMSDQNNDRQRDELVRFGVDPRDIFEDKASGRNMKRPGWHDCWRDLRKGDVLVIHAIDRLGRDLIEVSLVLREMQAKGVELVVLTQMGLDTRQPTGKMIFAVLLALAQWERESIVERTKHGLAAARARGRIGGSKKKVTDEQIVDALERRNGGERTINLARELDISTQALYRRWALLRKEQAAA
jgi:DNA invertase Pin-like site-specific DNA recombinase